MAFFSTQTSQEEEPEQDEELEFDEDVTIEDIESGSSVRKSWKFSEAAERVAASSKVTGDVRRKKVSVFANSAKFDAKVKEELAGAKPQGPRDSQGSQPHKRSKPSITMEEKMQMLASNPARDAIAFQQELRMGASTLLIEELTTLERFQPRDLSINVRKGPSFDFYVRKIYRPKENIEHIYQLTALALIMSSDVRTGPHVFDSPYFMEPLLKDIKYCLREV